MKTKTNPHALLRTASLLMIVLLLVATLAPVGAASDKLLKTAKATFAVPILDQDQTVRFNAVKSAEPDKYTAEIVEIRRTDDFEGGSFPLSEGERYDLFSGYYAYIRFTAKPGYMLDDDSTQYAVNGETRVTVTLVDEHTVRYGFRLKTQEQAEQEAAAQKYENSLQRKVVAALTGIFVWLASFFQKLFKHS